MFKLFVFLILQLKIGCGFFFSRVVRSFACNAHSPHSLYRASLCYTRFSLVHSLFSLALFKGSLTHFAHTLVGQWKIMNMRTRCKRVWREQTRFLCVSRNTPLPETESMIKALGLIPVWIDVVVLVWGFKSLLWFHLLTTEMVFMWQIANVKA